jgi:uncharacterized membrane protein YdjX (TVP38/TMEM64 family)
MQKDRTVTSVPDTPKSALPRWIPIAIIASVAVIGAFTLGDALSFEALADNREFLIGFRDTHYALTALAYVAIYVAVVAFSLPGATVMTLAGGFLFGLLPGAFFTVIAATIGATLIFLAARWGLGERLSARMDASDGAIRKLKQGLNENEVSVLFLMRLVPAIPFFVANLLPALVGVGLGRYGFTTFFGIMPGTVVYTWVGVGLGEVFARGETPDLGIIFEPYVLGPIIALCALAALPMIVKFFRNTRGA